MIYKFACKGVSSEPYPGCLVCGIISCLNSKGVLDIVCKWLGLLRIRHTFSCPIPISFLAQHIKVSNKSCLKKLMQEFYDLTHSSRNHCLLDLGHVEKNSRNTSWIHKFLEGVFLN